MLLDRVYDVFIINVFTSQELHFLITDLRQSVIHNPFIKTNKNKDKENHFKNVSHLDYYF